MIFYEIAFIFGSQKFKNKSTVVHNIRIDLVEPMWSSFPAGISVDTFAIVAVARISVASTGVPHVSNRLSMRVLALTQAASDLP